ncbi:hypothetical protein YQE_05186, partial [Dendroctonus ponderosae]
MPRTKKAASKQKNTRKTDQDPRIELGLKIINDAEESRLGQLQADRKNDLDTIKCEITTCMLSVPRGLLDLTLGEISRGEFPVDKTWNSRIVLGNSTLANASNTLHSTQSTIQKTGSRLKKTASHLSTENDDEGSPLLVYGATAQDRIANINIPIGDDVLSLMPTRGAMRPSEIPQIEGDTKKQLETLRDNLIKVCDSIRK